ncbi:hypothetical protein OSCI_1610011 [Kamptonema sp. PCC 6506]|nr:hypothetical protein OSCI_1610011 [Kamptonema sp. PCC 6506]
MKEVREVLKTLKEEYPGVLSYREAKAVKFYQGVLGRSGQAGRVR